MFLLLFISLLHFALLTTHSVMKLLNSHDIILLGSFPGSLCLSSLSPLTDPQWLRFNAWPSVLSSLLFGQPIILRDSAVTSILTTQAFQSLFSTQFIFIFLSATCFRLSFFPFSSEIQCSKNKCIIISKQKAFSSQLFHLSHLPYLLSSTFTFCLYIF